MIQSVPMTAEVGFRLSYADLVPALATLIDAFAVVLLVAVVVGLVATLRSPAGGSARPSTRTAGRLSVSARSRMP